MLATQFFFMNNFNYALRDIKSKESVLLEREEKLENAIKFFKWIAIFLVLTGFMITLYGIIFFY